MDFQEYQNQAAGTAIYPKHGGYNLSTDPLDLSYLVIKLAGECGEVSEKVGKAIRDGQEIDFEKSVALELGDVLWYVAMIARELGYPLNAIAHMNVQKLQSRHARGVIGGSGDER